VDRVIEPGLRLRGRYEVLRRGVENVVRNAVEATDARGIVVRAARSDSDIDLTIADHGPGVPVAERERIFQPYVTTKTQGTGLGLTMARHAATAHGGTLAVTDAPGGGAAFTFTLPAA
jgi:signal transduction histidine kinase